MSSSPTEAAATGESLSALEALHSTPSRRYLAPDPIPEEVLWAILDAAIRGPSGGNCQGWGWVVVTDQAVKARVAGWYGRTGTPPTGSTGTASWPATRSRG